MELDWRTRRFRAPRRTYACEANPTPRGDDACGVCRCRLRRAMLPAILDRMNLHGVRVDELLEPRRTRGTRDYSDPFSTPSTTGIRPCRKSRNSYDRPTRSMLHKRTDFLLPLAYNRARRPYICVLISVGRLRARLTNTLYKIPWRRVDDGTVSRTIVDAFADRRPNLFAEASRAVKVADRRQVPSKVGLPEGNHRARASFRWSTFREKSSTTAVDE